MRSKLPLLVLFVASLSACGGASQGAGLTDARDPEGALARLPAGTRAKFDAWKSSALKHCSLDAAFPEYGAGPSSDSSPLVLDGAVLRAKTGGHAALLTKNGRVGIITDVEGESAFRQQSSSLTSSENGSPSDLHAELASDGTTCKLTLFGQVVFDEPVFTRVNVGAMTPLSDTKPSRRAPGLWRSPTGLENPPTVAEMPALGALAMGLAPSSTDDARAMLAATLGVDEKDVSSLITASAKAPFAYAFTATTVPYVDADSNLVLGPRSEIAALVASASVPMMAYLRPASLTTVAESKREIVEWPMTVAFGTTDDTRAADASVNVSVSLSSTGAPLFTAPNIDIAMGCLAGRTSAGRAALTAKGIDRLERFSEAPFSTGLALWRAPSAAFAAAACEAFVPDDLYQSIAKTSAGRELVASMVGSASYDQSEWRTEYQGWDKLAFGVLEELLAKGGDVDAAMNPKGESSLFRTAAEYHAALQKEVTGPVTAEGTAAIAVLAYGWALHPASGRALSTGTSDFHLAAEDVARVGRKLQGLTSCPNRLVGAADAFRTDVTAEAPAWKAGCD